MAGIKVPTIDELDELLDDKTYEIYEKGLTCTINQADSNWATNLIKTYKPRSVAEMSAFVAVIRPGCASFLEDFINRKIHTTNIPELDDLLKEGSQRLLYQELIMKYLVWLGIPETGSYDIIKKIAKKKFKEPELKELKAKLLDGWTTKLHTAEGFEETWQAVEDAAHYSFNACVSADTILQRPRMTLNNKSLTVGEMYRIANDRKYARETNHLHLYDKYKNNGYGNALSMFDDKRIRCNKIVDIREAGIQKIYRVKMETGEFLDCTMNHKFPTPNGKKELRELKVGDILYVKGNYEKNHKKYPLTNGRFIKNHPKKGQHGFQQKKNGKSRIFHDKERKCKEDYLPCEKCGKEYSESMRFELPHIDGDRTNNKNSNLKWLCVSCHKKEHYIMGRRKVYEKGIPTEESKIESITFLREDMTYDIEMEAPAHTFVSESGLVTSNSHSLAYAYDSLYGAYLKSHYPLEYYTVALNMYNEDAERTARLTEELQYFKITLKSPKFGHSKSEYVLDRETNTIYKGCKSIKYVNEEVPNALYELAKNNYKTFSELLGDIKQTGINSRQLEILIKLNFFDVFGNSKELMILVELFDTFKWGDAKQISKDKIEEVSFIRQALDKYCTQTEKKYIVPDKATCLKILNELESQIKASNLTDYSLKDKIQWQQEYLGYTSASGRKEDSRLLIVKDIAAVKRKSDGKQFGYGIIFQSIGSGKQIRMTALNPVYKNCGEIKKGDVIYCIDYAKKGAYYNITKYKKNE